MVQSTTHLTRESAMVRETHFSPSAGCILRLRNDVVLHQPDRALARIRAALDEDAPLPLGEGWVRANIPDPRHPQLAIAAKRAYAYRVP